MEWFRAVLAGLGAGILVGGLADMVGTMVGRGQSTCTEIGWGAALMVFALCMPMGKKDTEGKE